MDEYGEVILEENQYYWLFHANDSYSAVKLLRLEGDDCRVEDYETEAQSDVSAGSLVGMIPAPGELTLRYVVVHSVYLPHCFPSSLHTSIHFVCLVPPYLTRLKM